MKKKFAKGLLTLAVDGQIAAETERVRAEIAATWKPKYAGRFVGKNKVILEDEI